MLGSSHSKVVVSTLREIRGLLPSVEEKVVNEVRRKLGRLASESLSSRLEARLTKRTDTIRSSVLS